MSLTIYNILYTSSLACQMRSEHHTNCWLINHRLKLCSPLHDTFLSQDIPICIRYILIQSYTVDNNNNCIRTFIFMHESLHNITCTGVKICSMSHMKIYMKTRE